MILRTKYIEKLHEFADTSNSRYIAVIWDDAVCVGDFLSSLSGSGVFHSEHLEGISLARLSAHKELKAETKYVIITGGKIEDFSSFQTIIEPKLHENIVGVFFEGAWPLDEEREGSTFFLEPMSFREYAEYRGKTIDIGAVMSGNSNIEELNSIRDEYIKTGGYPLHIEHEKSIFESFDKKRTIMKQELFEKEYTEFDEYMRALAMNTGNLFKSDGLAKLLGISRRKVNKYTEILMSHGIIAPLGPWGDHPDTETTRHVKLYFRELSFLRALLGDIHGEWQMRQWAIENFILIELMRKLDKSHDFAFYRKKSWAEITFIITDRENTLITPIEVSSREVNTISQAIKSFDTDYHARVERYMLWNNSTALRSDLDGTMVMILPHIAV